MLLDIWRRVTHVNVPDPDEARRRRLLNIILVGVSSITLILLIFGFFITKGSPLSNRFLIFGPFFIAINLGLYFLNRIYSGILASSIFVGILTILIVFADSPKELVSGRSLFFFSIPIVFASVLLRPWMSIGIALVCTIAQLLLSYLNFIPVNTLAIGGFLVLALFSWLSANGIESALTELRTINQDLDARVARRTEELAITNERLKELDLIRAKFVADVSHELRTPVGNLVAYLEMLHEKMEDPVRTKRYLTVLQDETQRLHSLVNSVLNLSRLEIGTSKLEFTSVNISDIAEQVVLAHDLRAKAHGLKIIFQPGKDIPAIWADSDQIKQVFNNILGNAVNYTMQNGKITVKTYAEKDKAIFEVTDTGIGIPPENIPYLFDRFYRGNNAGSSTISGSGLGLSIVKEIVETYQGDVEVSSELNQGSTFRVLLPVQSN